MRTCRKCGEKKPLQLFYRHPKGNQGHLSQCISCVNEREAKRIASSSDAKKRQRENQARYHRKLRLELVAAYGGKCECCSETEPDFLELDHVNGGGTKHRRVVGSKMCEVLRREGYPQENYRLLCSNCNHAMGRLGYCPHDKNR